MADGNFTYSAHGIEIEEDESDAAEVAYLKTASDEVLMQLFRYVTKQDRRLQQIVAEINSRKNKENN